MKGEKLKKKTRSLLPPQPKTSFYNTNVFVLFRFVFEWKNKKQKETECWVLFLL